MTHFIGLFLQLLWEISAKHTCKKCFWVLTSWLNWNLEFWSKNISKFNCYHLLYEQHQSFCLKSIECVSKYPSIADIWNWKCHLKSYSLLRLFPCMLHVLDFKNPVSFPVYLMKSPGFLFINCFLLLLYVGFCLCVFEKSTISQWKEDSLPIFYYCTWNTMNLVFYICNIFIRQATSTARPQRIKFSSS